MLNILQHYKKYHEGPRPVNSKATTPSQLCAKYANLNPKFRQTSNCTLVHPGQISVPNDLTSQPRQSVITQKRVSDQWIGVL